MDQLEIYLPLGLKHTHLLISLFPVHQYVNSKNAKDLKFLIREINIIHQASKDTFKYHCSAGPWDLKKSQGHHLQILTKEEKNIIFSFQSVCTKWYPLSYYCVIYSMYLFFFPVWLNVKECYLPCLL